MGLCRAMSSANSDIVLSGETSRTTSLMKIRNISGPRMELCATPEITGKIVYRLFVINHHTLASVSEVASNPLGNEVINTEFI